MTDTQPKSRCSILFVCTGNICRSAGAEGILRHHLKERGLWERVHLDSCGTSDYHTGEHSTPMGLALSSKRGYDYSDLSARQLRESDFEDFDLILAMAGNHLTKLKARCPSEHQHKLNLYGEFCAGPFKGDSVNDPYYGGAADYEEMFDRLESATENLIRWVEARN